MKWDGPESERHVLTDEDSKKGGSQVTERKRKANAVRNLKHGKYAKSPFVPDEFLNCDSCKHCKACSFYKKGESCRVQGVEPLKQLAQLYGVDAIELLQTINKELVAYGLLARGSEKLSDRHNFVKLLMEFFRLRFGSKELILQVSKTLNDEEFESLTQIYKKKVLDNE